MSPSPSSYQSYLLRLWQVKTNGEGWRVRLTHVDTGEQHIFTSMEAMFAYFQDVTHFSKAINGEKETQNDNEPSLQI